MQNKLRDDINRQHAPERLISETIEKLHMPQKKKHTVIYALPAAALVAAALFICINLTMAREQMRYQEVELLVLRDVVMEENIDTQRLELGGGTLLIKSSKECEVAPEELLAVEKTKIGEYNICLGTDKEESYYLAAFTKADTNYFFYARDCEKDEFEKYLKKFLNN